MAPVHSQGGYPPGYQQHLPPEADVNVEAMRKQAEADEAERRAEVEASRQEEQDEVRTATARPGDKSK
jgi:hypothetical protein